MIKRHLGTRRIMLVLVLVSTLVASTIVVGMSCSKAEASWQEEQAATMQITVETFSTVDRYSMLVLFVREENYFLEAIRGTHDFQVIDEKLYLDGNVIGIDTLVVGWGLYPEQKVEVPCEWDEILDKCMEVPTTLEKLNLRGFEAGDLPQSGHFARLDTVHPGSVLKAEVSRYFYGEWFTGIRCLATLSVMKSYQAGELTIGDYVWVYYTNDPRPGHEHEEVPIVIDKVMYDG